jgi:SAM-dependent methyltransferase
MSYLSKIHVRGKLLDVGCGFGLLLNLARSLGFNAKGIDPDRHAIQQARLHYNVPVYQSTIEEFRSEEKFDIIIFHHVLEHIADPTQAVKKITALLNSNGIVIVMVPNSKGILKRLGLIIRSKRLLDYLYVPEDHFWHFDYTTLERLFIPFGFKVEYSRSHVFMRPSSAFKLLRLRETMTTCKKAKNRILMYLFMVVLLLVIIIAKPFDSIGLGDHLLIVFRLRR